MSIYSITSVKILKYGAITGKWQNLFIKLQFKKIHPAEISHKNANKSFISLY